MVPKLDAESDEVQDDVCPCSKAQFQHLDIELEEISALNSYQFPKLLIQIASSACPRQTKPVVEPLTAQIIPQQQLVLEKFLVVQLYLLEVHRYGERCG